MSDFASEQWWAVQCRGEMAGRWITYLRSDDQEAAIAVAERIAVEWRALGPWRVALCAETAVWEAQEWEDLIRQASNVEPRSEEDPGGSPVLLPPLVPDAAASVLEGAT